ncbi:MAG: NAD(P)H-hydrate dehydratase, partial [Nitrospiria bacterium]
EMVRRYGPLAGKRVTVIAGKGNNGGDGLVVARHLHQRGIRVIVFLLCQKEEVQGDARVNLLIYEKIGGELRPLPSPEAAAPDIEALRFALIQSEIIVDAIFGTGLTDIRLDQSGKIFLQVISLINGSAKRVVAVDIPSGISSDSGEILGTAVKADLTVTFGLPKRGHFLFPGASYRGKLKIVDIGIPAGLVRETPCPVNLLVPQEIKEGLPYRPIDAHKGKFGHALVIAGSVGKTGAAAMAALSAMRVGAGLVTLATPSSLNPIMEQKLTEAMTVPLPETTAQTLSLAAEKALLDLVHDKSVVIIGPGLSTHPETLELVRRLLNAFRLPTVLDADGINALIGHNDLLGQASAKIVITPHPGEMARLLGITSQKIQSDRLGISQSFARRNKLWLILKGAHTVLADPQGSLFINPTGNEGMATGGTGDVLAGILGGLISQGLDPLQASKVGIYLHGLAGDLAALQKGTMGMIAGDVLECIPSAIQKIQNASADSDPYDPLGS